MSLVEFGVASLVNDYASVNAQCTVALSGGGYAVIFHNGDVNVGVNYRVQVYDSGHSPLGGPQDLAAVGNVFEVRAAALTDGGFAITWQTAELQSGSGSDIVAQRFSVAEDGTLTGDPVVVVSDAIGNQSAPSIAASGDGYAVVYTDIQFSGGSHPGAHVTDPNGGVRVYYDNGNFFQWTSGGGSAMVNVAPFGEPGDGSFDAPYTFGGAPPVFPAGFSGDDQSSGGDVMVTTLADGTALAIYSDTFYYNGGFAWFAATRIQLSSGVTVDRDYLPGEPVAPTPFLPSVFGLGGSNLTPGEHVIVTWSERVVDGNNLYLSIGAGIAANPILVAAPVPMVDGNGDPFGASTPFHLRAAELADGSGFAVIWNQEVDGLASLTEDLLMKVYDWNGNVILDTFKVADNIQTGEGSPSYPNGAYSIETLADGTIIVTYTKQSPGDGHLQTFVQRYAVQQDGQLVQVGDGNGAGPAAADTLQGGAGRDKLDGVDGDDTLFGFRDNDLLIGGLGNDALDGGQGDDLLSGGQGDDTVAGGAGIDSMDGGEGFDFASYAAAAGPVTASLATVGPQPDGDTLAGFEGLIGSAFADTLGGDGEVNVLRGGGGADTMTGGGDADVFDFDAAAEIGNAAGSRDVIADFVQGLDLLDLEGIDASTVAAGLQHFTWLGTAGHSGAGATLRYQQAGANTLVFGDVDANGSADFTIQLAGLHALTAGDFTDLSIAAAQGTNAAETVAGSNGQETVIGLGGNDTLQGLAGADTLRGGGGFDTMTGGGDADVFDFDAAAEIGNAAGSRDVVADFAQGVDRLDLDGIDALAAAAGVQHFVWLGTAAHTGAGATLRYQQAGTNTLVYGDVNADGAGDFTIQLNGLLNLTAADFTSVSIASIQGTAGNDTLFGALTGKIISGFDGNDTMTGGGGADTLWGGAGADSMTGGGGPDQFKWSLATHTGVAAGTRDIITDFEQGVDLIDLSAIDASTVAAGNNAFAFIGAAAHPGTGGTLRYQHAGGNTLVYGDRDADGAGDFAIQLTGIHTLTAADFAL